MSENKRGPQWVQGPYEIHRVEEEGCRCTAIRQVNGPQVGVVDDRGMTDAQIDGTATLFAVAPEMFEALEAQAAWAWVEDKHSLARFSECLELAKYAKWLTARVLSKISGDPFGTEYRGVPHLIVWPNIYLRNADRDEARALVERVITEWRQSIAKAKGETDADATRYFGHVFFDTSS